MPAYCASCNFDSRIPSAPYIEGQGSGHYSVSIRDTAWLITFVGIRRMALLKRLSNYHCNQVDLSFKQVATLLSIVIFDVLKLLVISLFIHGFVHMSRISCSPIVP